MSTPDRCAITILSLNHSMVDFKRSIRPYVASRDLLPLIFGGVLAINFEETRKKIMFSNNVTITCSAWFTSIGFNCSLRIFFGMNRSFYEIVPWSWCLHWFRPPFLSSNLSQTRCFNSKYLKAITFNATSLPIITGKKSFCNCPIRRSSFRAICLVRTLLSLRWKGQQVSLS